MGKPTLKMINKGDSYYRETTKLNDFGLYGEPKFTWLNHGRVRYKNEAFLAKIRGRP
jgi:hypothetical protein